jgi:sugar transferase (PEP-CTERM system associated)
MEGDVVGSLHIEDVRQAAISPSSSDRALAANEIYGPLLLAPRRKRRRLAIRKAAGFVRRVLIFGTGEKALQARNALLESDRAIEVVGFYASAKERGMAIGNVPVFGHGVMTLLDTARALKADEIVVAVADRRGGVLPLRELLDCKLNGIRVFDLASHFEQHLGQIPLDSLNAGWLIFGSGFRQGQARNFIKRAFDLVCSLTLLILALPIMAIAAGLIVWESGFPIFYRQQRVGHNNRLFDVIKFRSMRIDAERDGKPRWASPNDARVTRIGKLVRKLRIDELPQLIGVLKGDLSLVGPRPERPFFVDQLTAEIPFYAVRHSLKPGVTGWAQVRYHYGACKEDAARKLQYDLYYVKNHSLLLDIRILIATVAVVLSAKGAQ